MGRVLPSFGELPSRCLGFGHNERGATAVEFAIAAMAVLAILFVIVELGRLSLTKHDLERAVRVAGREAIVRSSNSENPINQSGVESLVRQTVQTLENPSLSVNVSYPTGNVAGANVVINAQYQYSSFLPFLPVFATTLGSDFTGLIMY